MSEPESCPHRFSFSEVGGTVGFSCGFASQLMGMPAGRMHRVERGACQACCESLAGPGQLNPVVASVVYGIASRIIRAGGEEGCTAESARLVQSQVRDHLGVVIDQLPGQSFPPRDAFRAAQPEDTPQTGRQWAIAMLTAPRPEPTIERTLQSLELAQLVPDMVLAEPGALLPPRLSGSRVLRHPTRLGNYRNFYFALATLWEASPDAECFCVLQDDIEIAKGAKEWCDREFWPLGAGIVSLYTPKLHAAITPGWRLRYPGFNRVFGAMALVFRRDVLQAFMADPHVFGDLGRRAGDDSVVSAWATRRGIGIAYHTPSLVQHIGATSSLWVRGPHPRGVAEAIRDVEDLAGWRRSPDRNAKIALVGYNAPTGLGYQNRELSRQLPIDRWLIQRCPYAPLLPKPEINSCVVPRRISNRRLEAMFAGIDWLLFAEQPIVPQAASVAHRVGASVACIPNWELLESQLPWLTSVDLMICPTLHTYRHVCDWNMRYGFGWDVIHVPWPIEVERFEFRLRRRCERFVFIGGWMGALARDAHGRPRGYTRKGLELVLQAARLAPHLSFIVYSQYPLARSQFPRNVELVDSPTSRADLYAEGDVCLQPSHWEGIGLQLLECQAAGMPLITTDAPPMNEYNSLATIPVKQQELICGKNAALYSSSVMDAADLVEVLERFHGQDVSEASQAARRYIETERNWSLARERILPHLVPHTL